MSNIEVRVEQNLGEIKFNYEDIKQMLEDKLSIFEGALVTEEGKTIAKKEIASLRKLKKEIDDRRKTVKKEWSIPYDEFNAKVQALLTMIDEPILLLDTQVKAFDEKQKQEKREKIKDIYTELIGDVAEYLTFERVYQVSWENVSTSLKKVREEMLEKIDSVKKDISTISSIKSDAVTEALNRYKSDLDAMAAVQYVNNYEFQKQEILEKERKRQEQEAERKKQEEIERARKEERRRIAEEEHAKKEAEENTRLKAEQEEQQAEQEAITVPEMTDDAALPFEQPFTKTVFYKVIATDEELKQVEMAFNSIGINFVRKDA